MSGVPASSKPMVDRADRDDVDQVVAIVTDGHENASREHTFADVAQLIADRTSRGWAFTYLAARFDAFEPSFWLSPQCC